MNPIVKGWYADPEARYYKGKYWVYVTRSFSSYKKQLNIDAFSSADGLAWEHHENIIEMEGFPWITRAVWAPTVVEKKGKHYLVFASNDIQKNCTPGGLEIACSDSPEGPFRAHMENPLIGEFINKAQPIDAHLFKDDDGEIYLYYGGWGHCNVTLMNEDMKGFKRPVKEITPPDYVEAPCMLKKDGQYHFMWSSGNWMNGTYRVLYSVSDSPFGPFSDPETILRKQKGVATGPGHHGWVQDPRTGDYYIFYHRRNFFDPIPGHRVLCRDILDFDAQGRIKAVIMT